MNLNRPSTLHAGYKSVLGNQLKRGEIDEFKYEFSGILNY